jgi:AraC-like DNA-binding protein
MYYREIAPTPDLQVIIKCLWALEHDYSLPSHDHERLWADPNIELIFSYDSPHYLRTGRGRTVLPHSFVIGPFRKELNLHSDGRTGLVAVRFWPWGAYQFSKKPIPELVNGLFPAEEVFGKKINSLGEQLASETHEQKLGILQDFFLEEARYAKKKNNVFGIGSSIIAQKGRVAISALTREFDLTPRRLERLFRRETGLSPKAFSRIVRFNHAKRLIERDPDISLAQLTCDAGFFDQSHFNKTFKEMFGLTPAAFKTRMKALSPLLCEMKQGVAFLQDG